MPEIRLTYRATVATGAEVFIESSDLATFQGALTALGLASANAAPAAEPAPAKPAKAPKAERPAPAAEPKVEAAPAAPPAPPPVEEAPKVRTPAEAASAIRAYGTKTSIDAAKKLLASLGMSRTTDITPERVEEVFEAIAKADL